MKIDKKICNSLRTKLKKFIKTKTPTLEELDIAKALAGSLSVGKIGSSNIASPLKDAAYNTRVNNFSLKVTNLLDIDTLRIQSILDALSPEGFKKATYSLPFFLFTEYAGTLDYDYLLLSGIKRNAQEKTENSPLMDDVEKCLWELEKKMGALMGDDYVIRIEDAKAFLEYLSEYLTFYYESVPFQLDKRFNFESLYSSVMINMALCIFYMHTGIEYDDQMFRTTAYKYANDKIYGGKESADILANLLSELCQYPENMKAMKDSIKKAIVEGKHPYEVSDETIGELKSNIDVTVDTSEEYFEALNRLIERVKRKEKVTLSDYDLTILSYLGNVDFTKPTLELLSNLSYYRDSFAKNARVFQNLKDSLAKDGVDRVTFSTPIICLFYEDAGIDTLFLLLTAIKKNAIEKDEKEFQNSQLERKLFEYEGYMSKLISDDYKIDPKYLGILNMTLLLYIDTYFEKTNLYFSGEFDYVNAVNNVMTSLVAYAIYCELGVLLDARGKKVLASYLTAFLTLDDYTPSQAVVATYEKFKEDYKAIEKSVAEEKRQRDYAKLNQYFKDGRAIASCDNSVLDEILNSLDMPEGQKTYYRELMVAFKEQQEIDDYQSRMALCREALFTDEEKTLYAIAAHHEDYKKTIESIDAITEMFLQESEENRLLLLDELVLCFDELRGMLPSEGATQIKFGYYTVQTAEGEVPLLLRTLRTSKKYNKEIVKDLLNDLASGLIDGDKEIAVSEPSNLTTIRYKGTFFQIGYVKIDDKIIVIDGGVGAHAIQNVTAAIQSFEFKEFITKLNDEDWVPNSASFEDTIMAQLSEGKKFKKQK